MPSFRIKKDLYLEIIGCFSATLYKVGSWYLVTGSKLESKLGSCLSENGKKWCFTSVLLISCAHKLHPTSMSISCPPTLNSHHFLWGEILKCSVCRISFRGNPCLAPFITRCCEWKGSTLHTLFLLVCIYLHHDCTVLYDGIVKKRKLSVSLLKNHPLSVFGSEFCFNDIVPISYQPIHTFTL